MLLGVARWGAGAGGRPPRTNDAEATIALVVWVGRWLVAGFAGWLLLLTIRDVAASLRGRRLCGPRPIRALVRVALPGALAVTLAVPARSAAGTSGDDPTLAPPTLVLLDDGPAGDGPPSPAAEVALAVTTPDPTEAEHLLQWRIEPGDHLWAVAERTLAWAQGHPPTVAATAAYLERLIGANRDRLVVPDEPDLVFPGQLVVLPPLP